MGGCEFWALTHYPVYICRKMGKYYKKIGNFAIFGILHRVIWCGLVDLTDGDVDGGLKAGQAKSITIDTGGIII